MSPTLPVEFPVEYIFALSSNLCFSLGSQAYAYFSQRASSLWMNYTKALIASFCFILTALCMGHWSVPAPLYVAGLMFSGSLGLAIGDIFLLTAFKEMGPGRTMMIFGFQPLIIGPLSFLFLGQELDWHRFIAILFFMGCVLSISYESLKTYGHWQIKGILAAALGVLLDACGIVVTRSIFNAVPDLHPITANFYRAFGAILFFLLWNQKQPLLFMQHLRSFSLKEKVIALTSPLIGTFLSLALFLMAVQKANLAGLSGIAITGTIFSSLFECIIKRRLPGPTFYLAFAFFLMGMKFLLF